jgi:hypothetical protein
MLKIEQHYYCEKSHHAVVDVLLTPLSPAALPELGFYSPVPALTGDGCGGKGTVVGQFRAQFPQSLNYCGVCIRLLGRHFPDSWAVQYRPLLRQQDRHLCTYVISPMVHASTIRTETFSVSPQMYTIAYS